MQLYTSPYIGIIYAKQKGYNKVYIYFTEIAFALQTLFQTPICNNPSNIGDGVKLKLLQIRQKTQTWPLSLSLYFGKLFHSSPEL